ncbi:hypothetical protein KI387_013585, partial [Taxus chinensis]
MPSFSCVVFTHSQSEKRTYPSITVKEKKFDDPLVATLQNKIISRGSPLPSFMKSTLLNPNPIASKKTPTIP